MPHASDVKWTDVAQIAVQLLVALGGIPFIIYQLREVKRSIQGETLSELYDHYHEVVSIFLEKPQLRPYFYANQSLDEFADPDLRYQVDTVCELIAGILEHALVQEENIPEGSWEECWESFVYDRLRASPVLREFLRANQHYYLRRFPNLLEELSAGQA